MFHAENSVIHVKSKAETSLVESLNYYLDNISLFYIEKQRHMQNLCNTYNQNITISFFLSIR